MVPDLLERAAFNYPDSSFFKYNNKVYTFSDINNHVNYMLEHNLPSLEKNKVGLSSSNPAEVVIGVFLCNRLNKTPVIFSEDLKAYNSCNEIVDIDCFLTEKYCIIQHKYESAYVGHEYDENEVQCVLFTSGTSGKPKGVELTFSNIFESCKNWFDVYSFQKNDTYLNILPLNHISGLSIFFRSLFSNFFIIYDGYNKDTILKIINENDVTCFSAVPKIIYDIIKFKSSVAILRKIKFLLIGGDLITEDVFDYLNYNNINAYISYGLTETSSGIAGYWINDINSFESGYIGLPHNNTELSIYNGYLRIKSKTVMNRYLGGNQKNNILLTKDKFIRKGDKFYFDGRNTEQIVSGGENINLNYIQKILNESKLNDIIVSSSKCEKWGDIIVVLYKSNFNDDNIISLIEEFFENNFPKFMFPKQIINIPNIPKLDNKKIDYESIKKYIERRAD